jgi:hypothetical protein
MIVVAFVFLVLAGGDAVAGAPAAIQSARAGGCADWRDCRQQALAAAERGDYEAFHDLAWRAVQAGPPRDPELMLLLARAQALSGRPHDALVMLERLAEMGVASDAETSPDFSRTRHLPGWPDVSARIARVTRPDAPSMPSAPAATAPTPSPTPKPIAAPTSSMPAPSPSTTPAAMPSSAAEAVRFSTGGFALGGVAYDAVSERFLFGDRRGRKLIIVAKGSDHATDFVRADSAGFHDIAAIEIDAKRGDLWVASTEPAGSGATLHKLQLVSGRPLKSFPVASDLEPFAVVDLAVTPAGGVLALDSIGGQLLELRPGGTALERVIKLDAGEPASLAAGDDDGIAYVAHRDGVSRIHLRARTAARVTAARSISLAHLQRIRWSRRALIAVRIEDDGSRRIVRLDLNASGRAVTKATILGEAVPTTGQTFVTISGDDLIYLAEGEGAGDGSSRAAAIAEFIAYRVRLR